MTANVPTLTFPFKGRIYSVTKICEGTNTVHASLTKHGKRLRGRPRHFKLGDIPAMKVRNIRRQTASVR